MTNKAVSKWETNEGCPDIKLIPELCRALDMTTDELLTGVSARLTFWPGARRTPPASAGPCWGPAWALFWASSPITTAGWAEKRDETGKGRFAVRTAQIIRPTFAPGRRIVAVSDIHGNLPFFRALLERVGLDRDDILILVGDLLEKGPQSLDLLRCVMELSRRREVYTLCGNCDDLVREFVDEDGFLGDRFYQSYLPRHPESAVWQLGEAAGCPRPELTARDWPGCAGPSDKTAGPSWTSCAVCPTFWRPST